MKYERSENVTYPSELFIACFEKLKKKKKEKEKLT